jgi:hypothetical protein
MTRYEWACIDNQAPVCLQCTDGDTLARVAKAIKAFCPRARAIEHNAGILGAPDLVSNESHSIIFDRLDDNDRRVIAWIFTELCHQGWEPYAVRQEAGPMGVGKEVYYYFRLAIEANQAGS